MISTPLDSEPLGQNNPDEKNESTPLADPSATKEQKLTESIPDPAPMEVHHHAHTERKKITHYFFEFFMLFLAVFAGSMSQKLMELINEQYHLKP
jgi:hypothetical protein